MSRLGLTLWVVTFLFTNQVHAQIGFQPTVAPAFSGAQIGVTGVVSPDRRYVRVGVNANFQDLVGFQNFPVPAVAGGVGGGGGFGAGGPGGGLRSVGGVGFAGMNGAMGPGVTPWNDRPLASTAMPFYDPALLEPESKKASSHPTKLQAMKARRRKGVIAKSLETSPTAVSITTVR